MTRPVRFGAVVGVYAALSAFCAFGTSSVSVSVQKAIGSYFWLLGPPANLVWGMNYVWPFVVGTIAVAVLAYSATSARTRSRKAALGVVLVLVWVLFGCISYAPAA